MAMPQNLNNVPQKQNMGIETFYLFSSSIEAPSEQDAHRKVKLHLESFHGFVECRFLPPRDAWAVFCKRDGRSDKETKYFLDHCYPDGSASDGSKKGTADFEVACLCRSVIVAKTEQNAQRNLVDHLDDMPHFMVTGFGRFLPPDEAKALVNKLDRDSTGESQQPGFKEYAMYSIHTEIIFPRGIATAQVKRKTRQYLKGTPYIERNGVFSHREATTTYAVEPTKVLIMQEAPDMQEVNRYIEAVFAGIETSIMFPRPDCFRAEKDNPYPLCVGAESKNCQSCCLHVNYSGE